MKKQFGQIILRACDTGGAAASALLLEETELASTMCNVVKERAYSAKENNK